MLLLSTFNYVAFMNEAHYQWHSLTAGRFILVHNKALTFEKRGLQNQFTVCSIWVSKRCKKNFIFRILFIRSASDRCQKKVRYLLMIQQQILFLNLLNKHQMKYDYESPDVFWCPIWRIKDNAQMAGIFFIHMSEGPPDTFWQLIIR